MKSSTFEPGLKNFYLGNGSRINISKIKGKFNHVKRYIILQIDDGLYNRCCLSQHEKRHLRWLNVSIKLLFKVVVFVMNFPI